MQLNKKLQLIQEIIRLLERGCHDEAKEVAYQLEDLIMGPRT